MATGLTYKICDGTDTSLRGFALTCVRQLGAGYHASQQGEKDLPRDHAPKMVVSDYHPKQIKKAEEDLEKWLKAKKNPEEAQRLYEEEKASKEKSNKEYEIKDDGRRERYESMIKRVEEWNLPETYGSLKDLMLRQLRDSLNWDCRDLNSHESLYSPMPPIDEWIDENIQYAIRGLQYHREELKKEQECVDTNNAYLQGLYDELDKVEPLK